jgi:hypothetical protein
MMTAHVTRLTVCAFLLATSMGCGGPTPPPTTPSPLPPPTLPSYDGTWSGVTGQSQPFSFVITNDQVSTIDLTYMLSGRENGCSGTGDLLLDSVGVALSSTAISVVFSDQGSQQLALSLKGTFTSAAEATGTFHLTVNAMPSILPGPSVPCDGTVQTTWTAQRVSTTVAESH